MMIHLLITMVIWFGIIYVAVGLLGRMLISPSKKIKEAPNFNLKVKELKKSLFKTIQHKIFPRMILSTFACIADDNMRMVWEVYRYDIDASMTLVIPKKNGILKDFESSVKIKGMIVPESVKPYATQAQALDAFDKFCHTKFDLYQHVYNQV